MDPKEELYRKINEIVNRILEERRELVRKAWEEFETNLQESLHRFLTHLRVDFRPEELENLKERVPELPIPSEPSPEPTLELLYQGFRAIKQETSQARIITHLLNTLSNLVNRSLFFVVKEGQLFGWDGRGFAGFTEMDFRRVRFSLQSPTIMRDVLEREELYLGPLPSSPENQSLIEKFIGEQPQQIMLVPVIIKGKPIGIVYADELPEKINIRRPKEIEMITGIASMMLEIAPLRTKYTREIKEKPAAEARPQPQSYVGRPSPSRTFEETKPGKPPIAEEEGLTPEEEGLTPEEEAALHEAAKRRARVLVSDLLLYHGDKIEEAKRSGNIYEKLKDEIELARMSYLRKVDPRVKKDYFYEELLNKIAGGDPNLLKGYPVQ